MKCQAILVNFHNAQLIAEGANSLLDDPACDEIHVVDNSVCPAESAQLRELLDRRIHLTVCSENLGFAKACNLAFAASEAECTLLLNPDARLFPGALQQLKSTLKNNPRSAAVGPRVFWDFERNFLLPPSTYPSRTSYLLDRLSQCWPELADWRNKAFRKRSLREWQHASLFRVNALSGGLVLLRRNALHQAGGLFDPCFFMYWEDSDLMRRLQDAGYQLLLEPRAEAVHLYEHSPEKDKMIADGWQAYSRKHFSSPLWELTSNVLRHFQTRPTSKPDFVPIDLRSETKDIAIPVPAELQTGWLLEFSPSPEFYPSIGRLGHGKAACLPYALATRFKGQSYYLRLGGTKSAGPFLCFSIRTS